MLDTKKWVCPENIQAVIFDVDGLLLDTEKIYTQVTEEVIKEWGNPTLSPSLKASLLGLSQEEGLQKLIDSLSLPTTTEYILKKMQSLYYKFFPNCQAKEGAKELVTNLASKNVPIAVGTSSPQDYLDWKMEQHQDWFSLFKTVVTPDHKDVKQAKPCPDIYLIVAKELNIDPKNCLVLEDSPAGLTAANSAGMFSVVIPEKATSLELVSHADKILSSLSNVVWHN